MSIETKTENQQDFQEMRRSLIGSLNPITKLVGLLFVALPPLLSVDLMTSGLTAAFSLLVLAPLAGINVLGVLIRVWPLLLAGAGTGWAVAVGAKDSGPVLVDLGWMDISQGSLEAALAMVLRSLALALPAVLVMATTDTSELGDALAQIARLPHRFVLGSLAALRVVGLMVEDFNTLRLARRARGVGSFGSVWERAKANAGLSLALVIQVIRRGSRMAVTMDARGFSSRPRTWLYPSKMSLRDGVALCACALLSGSIWWVAAAWGYINIVFR